jgi:hypothetical protein
MTPTTPEESDATTAPSASAPPARQALEPSNPFMSALIVFMILFAIVAIILYIVAGSQGPYSDPDSSIPFVVAGNTWLEFAGVFFVAAMIVGGINWHLTKLKK